MEHSLGNQHNVREDDTGRRSQNLVNFVLSDDPHQVPKCRGLLVGTYILTARHCVDWFSGTGHEKAYVQIGGNSFRYTAGEFAATVANSPPANVNQALSLDFALIKTPAAMSIPARIDDPIPSSDIRNGLGVYVADLHGRSRECHVAANCGAQVEIECNLPFEAGMSGSPIYANWNGSFRPIATLTQGQESSAQRRYVGVGTLHTSVMARSSELAEIWNSTRNPPRYHCATSLTDERSCALQHEFARRSLYRYPLGQGSQCRSAVARRMGSALHVVRLSDPHKFVAVAKLSNDAFVAVDRETKSACLIFRSSSDRFSCFALPSSASPAARSVIRLSDTRLAITDDSHGIATVDYDLTVGKIFSQSYKRSATPLEQVITAIPLTTAGILVGGEGGSCILEDGTCKKVVRFPDNPKESVWTVRSFLRLPSNVILGLGRDFDENNYSFARCARYAVNGTIVTQLPWCSFPNSASQLKQLSFGVNIKDEPLAFAKNGEVVSLRGERIGPRIRIHGLFESLRPSTAFDDAPRAVIAVNDDNILLAASDGSIRMLRVERQNGQVASIKASDRATAFDLAIWIVSMDATLDWALAVAQSGEIYSVTWSMPIPTEVYDQAEY